VAQDGLPNVAVRLTGGSLPSVGLHRLNYRIQITGLSHDSISMSIYSLSGRFLPFSRLPRFGDSAAGRICFDGLNYSFVSVHLKLF
jgi:hypothetical protein